MRICALLPDDGFRALGRSLGFAHNVMRAVDAVAAREVLSGARCDAFVLDPGVSSNEEFETVLDALVRTGMPVLLFTSLVPRSACRIVRVAESAAPELVLRGDDDEALLLSRKLATLVEPSAPALLLNRSARSIRTLPEPLQTSAVALFGDGRLPRWVGELACASGIARRSIDRWMHRAGINGAAMLLDTARLARAWEPLVVRRLTPADAAVKCGYARTRLLVAHARRLAGVSPPELGSLTRLQFVGRLARELLAR